MSEYLTVEEAQARIINNLRSVSDEIVPLSHCAGRILAEDVSAGDDLPPFANSSMDGFAVIASDVAAATPKSPIILEIAAEIPAGAAPTITLRSGQAARIMTGAMVPAGANAIIPVENTGFAPDLVGDQAGTPLPRSVSIFHPAQPGDNIRPRGQDVIKGQVVLTRGRRLQAQDVGILAATGRANVSVYRKPLVALFSSGDELAQPGHPLLAGQIYDSNQFLLAAMLEKQGANVLRLGTAPDDPQQIRILLDQAVVQNADLIVTSAGVSVGAFDYVRQVIETNGDLNFWKVNMRPGKPLAFGFYVNTPLIGLPGNPVSAFVGCRVFVLPAISQLSGQPKTSTWKRKVNLAEPVESDGRESYLRAFVQEENGRLVARLTGHQGSGNLFSLVQANALLIVPSGVKSLPSDSEVDVWFFDTE
ncbi:MAG: molybdopterin molybdotransferase MoeA [Anaerolineaceae bacterium]|nr:molybdopterin molybdotransferase MoeA [Anaerolineaceae bacterium]